MFQAWSVLPQEGTAVQKYARVEVNTLPHTLRLHLVRNAKKPVLRSSLVCFLCTCSLFIEVTPSVG